MEHSVIFTGIRRYLCLSWEAHLKSISSTMEEIKRGENINVVGKFGNTAVHMACVDLYPTLLLLLLRYDPNFNIKNVYLQTPFHVYMTRLVLEPVLLELILKKGADPNIPDATGNTSFHHFAKNRKIALINSKLITQILLKYKAKINSQNINGDTPLHCAVRRRNVGFIKAILQTEASVLMKNNKNLTAMDLAYTNKNDEPEVFIEIAKFAIILNHCRIPVNQAFLDEIHNNESLQIFNEQCNEELKILRNIKVGNTNVSLNVIVKSSTYTFAKYLRNDEILEWFQNFEPRQYKIFGYRLNQHFQEGLARREAEDSGYISWRNLFPNLPEVCVNKIISYLNNKDLYNISIDSQKYVNNIKKIPSI